MKRIVNIDFETNCKNAKTALARFAKKFPEQFEEWGELIEWMLETGHEMQDDSILGDGSKQPFTWAVHALHEENWFYFAVIERA